MKHDQTQFDLTDKQKEVRAVFSTAAKYFLIYGGSRSGKTFFICYSIIIRALKAPGSRHAIFRRHGVAVKQSIGKDTLPKVIELAFPGLSVKWHEQDGYFSFPNGSEIWLAGLDDKERVDKVLGREFATLYFNEASEVPLPSYMVALTRLAQQVRDVNGNMLSLKCYVDLNPTTSAHWSYQMWVLGVDPVDGRPLPRHAEDYRYLMVNPVDNSENLSPDYVRDLANMPERMRRRFYDGVFTADDDNALWRRSFIKVAEPPEMQRIVIAVDPAVSAEIGSDETGLVAIGLGIDNYGYVLGDESGRYRPEDWARRAVSMYDTYDADCIVAEINQGGEMVESMIKAASRGRSIRYKGVHATRAKQVRAEPIASLYEQDKVKHADHFSELEDQMCAFTIGFDRKAAGYSPDRVDALVWGLTELFPKMVKKQGNTNPVRYRAKRRFT